MVTLFDPPPEPSQIHQKPIMSSIGWPSTLTAMFERHVHQVLEMIDELHRHGLRSAWISAQLCTQLALPADRVSAIARAAVTHDIGKQGLPATLLDKPAPLTSPERRLIERHCMIGAGMLLVDASQDTAASSTVAVAVALSHHEWWNGQGYPFGLSGDAIPQCGRIVAVADVFDALVSVRPYKLAWSVDAAVDYIDGRRGTQFDPECVDAMLRVARDLPIFWQSAAQAGSDSQACLSPGDAQGRRVAA